MKSVKYEVQEQIWTGDWYCPWGPVKRIKEARTLERYMRRFTHTAIRVVKKTEEVLK